MNTGACFVLSDFILFLKNIFLFLSFACFVVVVFFVLFLCVCVCVCLVFVSNHLRVLHFVTHCNSRILRAFTLAKQGRLECTD